MTASLQRAINYLNQAIAALNIAIQWVNQAGVTVPIESPTTDAIAADVADIVSDVDDLIAVINNVINGDILNPIASINVNLKVVAKTAMYVVPAGKTLIVVGCVVRQVSATAPNNDSALNIIRMSDSQICVLVGAPGSLANNNTFPAGFSLNGSQFAVAAGDVVQVDVTGGDTGTAITGAVDLLGYLV